MELFRGLALHYRCSQNGTTPTSTHEKKISEPAYKELQHFLMQHNLLLS